MRLIDADALIEAIRNHYENIHCEDAVLNNFYRLAHEHVIDVVNIQKTAYETENVVAEIEKESVESGGFMIIHTEEVCDIVKRGGIE